MNHVGAVVTHIIVGQSAARLILGQARVAFQKFCARISELIKLVSEALHRFSAMQALLFENLDFVNQRAHSSLCLVDDFA